MKQIKKIMACVDFSEYSQLTMEYAVELAKDMNAKEIVVYHVINQREFRGLEIACSYIPGKTVEDIIKSIRKERDNKLKQFITTNFFDDKAMMILKIEHGIPFQCILKAIESEDIDLVVMANKGRGNISGILFGSVAEKVFRHSPVPVLSVRDRAKFHRKY